MARIALNVLYDAEGFPVDLGELMALDSVNLALTRSFLNACAIEPRWYAHFDDSCADELVKFVLSEGKDHLGGGG